MEARESRADAASLRRLLQPRSVAVVGASPRRATVGRAILHNIVTGGFTGPVYAVNPCARALEMEGVPCVASVDDLPGPVDLAVIAVPPSAVPEVAVQCGRNGVRGLIVISASRGAAGAELLAVCRRYGMRLVGPNCFGVMMPWTGLDATFTAGHPVRGVAGLMVQSGGVGIALLEQMSRLGIGVSSFVSAGDKYDVSPTDLLTWWAQDEVTQLAVLYVESFGKPRKFAGTARRVAQRMPVLTVIGARSPAGHRAASHTAAAATPLASQEAMFDLAGVIAATSLGELVDTAALLACQPLAAGFGPRPRRVLVQPMLAGGVEVHIGVVQEPVFGPLVVFGSSDAATAEVPGDQVTRLTPLTDADAEEMIHAVRAAPLLAGDRGAPPADTAALADALLRVSRLADDLPEVSELDLDPVVARPDGVLVRGRAGADQPGRAQGSLPAPAAVSTRQRTDSQRCARPGIPGSQPGAKAALVLPRAFPGSGLVRPHAITIHILPAESLSASSRRRGQLTARRSSRSGRYPGGGSVPLGMSVE